MFIGKLKSFVFFCIISLLLVGEQGCSWLRNACADVMPALIQGQSFASDAAQSLQQAERFLEAMPVTNPMRVKLVNAIEKGHDALRAASSALASTADACKKPDMVTIFRAFLDAWEVVRVIVGDSANLDVGKVGISRTKVLDPLIYDLAVKQGAAK